MNPGVVTFEHPLPEIRLMRLKWTFARPLTLAVLGVLVLTVNACLHTFWEMKVASVAKPDSSAPDSTIVHSKLKAHLLDGSTVVFPNGTVIWRNHLGFKSAGVRSPDSPDTRGIHYPVFGESTGPREMVPLDSVVGIETFTDELRVGKSVIVSVAATAAAIPATALLLMAIFGSCPTVYADTGAGPELQAEGFSYSIAPIMERRDVDPLRTRVGADGRVRLELRNEALETHYLNHVELLAVHHPAGSRVVPDENGHPIATSAFGTLRAATDRSGRDVRAALATADGRLYSTAPRVIAAARQGDLDDWIDLDVSDLPPGDSIAVVLRLRNSLLNTVLLYDGMLGGRDAVDWLDSGLQHIATAVDLARWYTGTMGLRASVPGTTPAATRRLGDVGPLAFRDVAIILPRKAVNASNARVHLQFVADNWRIDEVRVAGAFTRPQVAALAVEDVIVPVPARGVGPVHDTAAVTRLREADDGYLQTDPGQRMTLVFAADRRRHVADEGTTTYLIAWQGWYREWIRGAWLAEPTRITPFVPGDGAVLDALTKWTARKADFERAFYSSRIPVR